MGHSVGGAGHSANHDGPRGGNPARGKSFKSCQKDKHRFWILCVTHEMCLFVAQEDLERTQINVLAVQAITSLVLSAMTLPTAGNPAISCPEQQPRNKILKALDTRYAHIYFIHVLFL